MSRVAVLSNRSVFIEGVAVRLRQLLESEALLLVDAYQDDALHQVVAARPSVVIMDAGETASGQFCRLGQLLEALPLLTIIGLDVRSGSVRVVISAERRIGQAQDLLGMIKTTEA